MMIYDMLIITNTINYINMYHKLKYGLFIDSYLTAMHH